MKIAISGASGLIGKALSRLLAEDGHTLLHLVRHSPTSEAEIRWDPRSGLVDSSQLEGIDAFFHLAGENIASGRWTDAKMRRIRDSRVHGTHSVCEVLAKLDKKPATLVCASAIGFYGDRGEEVLTEESPGGSGFLPDVCREWEAACDPAREAGIRVVNLRIGVVLSNEGGALAKMLLPFRMGLGGNVGNGRQYWSWITLTDVARALVHVFETESVSGPVNAVAPNPSTNAAFTKALGGTLGRPTLVPMPAFAARIALGKMAEDLLLASLRVAPRRLEESGFRFEHAELEPALRHLLG